MIDFEKRKEKSALNSQIHPEEPILNTEQSKYFYEITFTNNNQIKELQKEIHILKTQMCDILNIFNDKSLLNKYKIKSNKYSKEEKNNEENDELIQLINKEITNQLNDNMKVLNNKLNMYNDNIKSDLDSKIEQIKNELSNQEKEIISLNKNKLDKVDFDKNINTINPLIKEKKLKSQFELKSNEVVDINRNNTNSNSILNTKDLNKIKKEIYSDFEKINIKILNELKNQAYDIKSLYQELQTNNKNNIKNSINTEEDISSENIGFNPNKIMKTLYNIEKELAKKVNLEHLNFALSAQSQLNEALNSTCQLCRLCWDSEGVLLDNNYIQWSSQHINTALNVFKWELNSEVINIMQKGVYKIVVGLIGLESNKNIKICINDNNKKIYVTETEYYYEDNYTKENEKERNYCNDEGNVKYIEKYFACVENSEIKIKLIDYENNNNDTTEEAFLQLIKII